jgi:amidase
MSAAGLTSFRNVDHNKSGEYSLDESNDDFILNETTIDALQQKMRSGALTSETITMLYLTRIREIDKKGPRLNSIN